MSDFWRAWRCVGLAVAGAVVIDIASHWDFLNVVFTAGVVLVFCAGQIAPYRLTNPWAPRQICAGTGAWGRVTRRDKRKSAEMRAEIDRRIASGEYKPIRYLKDETGRFVRVAEENA